MVENEASGDFVVIVAGSDSDREHVKKIAASLDKYGIGYQARICSAHKQPRKAMDMIAEYGNFPLAYIAVAGGIDALSGLLSFHSTIPVISCPPDAPNMSCCGNPPGSSNAYIPRADNAARFVAQMYSRLSKKVNETLELEQLGKIKSLDRADTQVKTGGLEKL